MSLKKIRSIIALSLWVIGLMSNLEAAPISSEPVHLEADSVDIDEQKGISVYRGNVVLNQANMRLSAVEIQVFSHKGKLQKIIAKGNPVKTEVTPEGGRPPIFGTSLEVEFHAAQRLVIMQNSAKLSQGRNEFQGHRIEYNMDKNLISAHKSTNGNERVKVIIHPQDTNLQKK